MYEKIQGILLGMACSIALSGFVGLGNIFAGREDLLPNMRLDLTLRGCPCTNGTKVDVCTGFYDPSEWWKLDLADNSNWKDNDYSFWVKGKSCLK